MRRSVARPLVLLLAALLLVSTAPRQAVAAGPPIPWLTPVSEGATNDFTFEAFSRDGTHLFVSGVDPITDEGPAGVWDVGAYTFDLVTPPGVKATFAKASPDGSAVFFLTAESLVPEDPGTDPDLYRAKDGAIDLVSLGTSEGVSRAWWVSEGGTRALFESGEALTPDDPTVHDGDWYLWDEASDSLRLLTADLPQYGPIGMTDAGDRILVQEPDGSLYDTTGGETTFLAKGTVSRLSPDETRLYITSPQQLVPEDTDSLNDAYVLGPDGWSLMSPDTTDDVTFGAVSDDGESWLIQSPGALLPVDLDNRSDYYLATDHSLTLLPSSDLDSWLVAWTADLSTLVLRTQGWASPADTDSGEDLYRWDASAPTALTLLSSGTDSHIPTMETLSPDGSRVIFQTEEDVLPETADDHDSLDVYEWWNGTITNLGPGATTPVVFKGTSADGRRVAFVTAADLVHRICTPDANLFLSDRQVQPPARPPEDMTPPVGTLSIAGGAAVVPNRFVTLAVPATDAGPVTKVALSNDGIDWTTKTYLPTWSWTLGPTSGTATVYAKWLDSACNWSVPIMDTVIVATAGPSSTVPIAIPASSTNLVSGSYSTRLVWTSPDPDLINFWELEQRTDAGPWTSVGPGLVSPTTNRSLRPGHTYAFRVRAVDHLGHIGNWATGSPIKVTGYSEASSAVRYTGSWSTNTSTAYWGGKAKSALAAGAKATLTFTGRSVAIVSRLGPGRGKAEIWVGSTKMATIDLGSTSYSNQRIVWSKAWTTSAKRTVTIKVLGTAGRPRVEVDGFLLGS